MSMSMQQLMDSLEKKTLHLSVGDLVEGKVVLITDSEIVLDLGAKSEGILDKKDLTPEQSQKLKAGDKLSVYITEESSSGQLGVSTFRPVIQKPTKRGFVPSKKWTKFLQAQQSKNKLTGKVIEQNKGGYLVEVDGVRGFLPSSQLPFESLSKLSDIVGTDIKVFVIEVDESSNRLIFSGRDKVSGEILEKLNKFKDRETVKGVIVAIFPFGLFVDIDGVEGLVKISEASWERVEDLNALYSVGDTIESEVLSVDKELGRLNLSIKGMSEDPFVGISEKFQADDVVTGTVLEVTTAGVKVELPNGVEGFVDAGRVEGNKYTVGQKTNFLVDSVDKAKRRVNLAPFITSTVGLIYK